MEPVPASTSAGGDSCTEPRPLLWRGGCGAPVAAQVGDAARTAIAGAATAFLATLSPDVRRRAAFAFDNKEVASFPS